MSEEKLYNLSLKDYTLEVWKCKLGYPLNRKDIEELEHIIDYYEKENQHKDLQQRIDKVVEYINDLSLDFYDYECEQLIVGKHMINELLEILKGDKE